MTSLQESKLSMYLVVKDLLSQTPAAIINTMPNFSTYQTTFNTNVTKLQSIREVQEVDRTGLATNKSDLETDLIAKAIDVVSRVKAYAMNTNNTVLAAEVGYTKSDLEKSADTVIRDKCQVIWKKANDNLAALNTYGVTQAMLTALQTAITAFNNSIPKPRLGITIKKQATDELQHTIDDTDLLLSTKMDTLVEIVKTAQPVFYKNYSDARMLITTGSSIISTRGVVKDKNTSQPMSGVSVHIQVQGSDTTPQEKHMTKADAKKALDSIIKTTDKGHFQLKKLPSGTYTFTFTKSGYKTLVQTVPVTDGERTELNLEMEPV